MEARQPCIVMSPTFWHPPPTPSPASDQIFETQGNKERPQEKKGDIVLKCCWVSTPVPLFSLNIPGLKNHLDMDIVHLKYRCQSTNFYIIVNENSIYKTFFPGGFSSSAINRRNLAENAQNVLKWIFSSN